MAVTRWEPFRDLVALQERMNRLFDESLQTQSSHEESAANTWTPAVDIYETDTELVIKAELPEVKRKEIEIKVENNVLILRGQRRLEKAVKEESYHRIERAYGAFSRSFTLPANVDQNEINAAYKDGILSVRIQKREETKPRQIEVR